MRIPFGLALAAVAAPALILAAEKPAAGAPAAAPRAKEQLFQAPPPPFSPGIFPCSQCHTGDVNAERRELAFHEEIVFKHDAENRWCLDCHDARNRDVLHLSSGAPVPFTESYRLCGQCHGDKYRDWKAGVHGKRTGMWNGEKQYLLCVHCHNSHSPRFQPLVPEPAPVRPTRTR